jgi:hypothetical protein
MRLTDRQLQAALDACLEAQAGSIEEWHDDLAAALPATIAKLKAEYWRRQEIRPGERLVKPDTNPHAAALGRIGGSSTSEKKAAASRANGRAGGRPRITSV